VADVLEGIIAQARTGPDGPAVRDSERELSYGELLEEAAQLGAGLQRAGVGEGDRVALLLPNSVDFVSAALGALWIGAAFVPLAVADPEVRLATIVTDCAAKIVIVPDERDAGAAPPASLGGSPVVAISDLRDEEARAPWVGPSPRVAYMIYTSGTTGTPKGVQIGNRAFGAAIASTSEAIGFSEATRALCVSPFHFDGSYGTLFPTLYRGGLAVMRPQEKLLFLRTFFTTVAEEEITHTTFTPSYLRLLLGSPHISALAHSRLEVIQVGGEALNAADLRSLWSHAPHVRVFNCYGPTETTIAVTHGELTAEIVEGEAVPMGYPHPGVTFYLLDEGGEVIQEPNRAGELYIGGDQLMDGYWRAPALTEEVLRDDVVAGETLYRTGDLVYRDRSGRYVFVDRLDRVIKRRGVRISLVELNETFRSLPHVTEAACTTFDDGGDLGIVAFVVGDSELTVPELRSSALTQLPENMMPNRIELIEALPLNKSNKLDVGALLANAGLAPYRAAPASDRRSPPK